MVDLELLSPGANGSISVMVSGSSDGSMMIAEARDILPAALERWARVMARALDGERMRPKVG